MRRLRASALVAAIALALPVGLVSQQSERPPILMERNPAAAGGTQGNSMCRETEKESIFEVIQRGGSCRAYVGVSFKRDTDIEVEASLLDGPDNFGYGLMFGKVEGSNGSFGTFYQFVVTANGYYRLRFWDGSRDITLIDWTRHPAIKKGRNVVNEIRVITEGNLIRCLVNDLYVGGHVATGNLVGGAGYIVEEFGMRAQFHTLVARDLPPEVKTGTRPGRTLFSDDLITNKKFQEGGGIVCKAGYDAEGYVVENVASRGLCDLPLSAAGTFGSNTTVSVRVKLRQGPKDQSFGVYVGRESATSNPLLIGVIDGQGTFQIAQRTTGWQRLTRLLTHTAIHQGFLWNQLRIEVRGQTIRGYVNGALTGQAHVDAPIRGQIGFYVNSPDMVAVFRDLSVVEN